MTNIIRILANSDPYAKVFTPKKILRTHGHESSNLFQETGKIVKYEYSFTILQVNNFFFILDSFFNHCHTFFHTKKKKKKKKINLIYRSPYIPNPVFPILILS